MIPFQKVHLIEELKEEPRSGSQVKPFSLVEEEAEEEADENEGEDE
jgi:hypothetical protein